MTGFGLHFSCSSLHGGDWPDLYDEAIDLTRLAEELGFSHALVAEHHFTADGHVPAPTVLSAALAAVTSRITVGTDILVTPLHHPLKIAEDILVLDNLSRGRVVCGLGMGSGQRDFAAFEVPFRQRVSRTEEAMQILDVAMTGAPVTFEGRYHSMTDVTVTPPPVQQPRPPMYYGTMSVPGAQRAARLADGMVISPGITLDGLPAIREAFDTAREEAGRTGHANVMLRREAFVAATAEEAREVGLRALLHQYSHVYGYLDPDTSLDEFERYAAGRFVFGTVDDAISQVQQFVEATGCDTLVFRVQVPGLPAEAAREAVRLLGAEVLPAVTAWSEQRSR